MEVVNFGFFRAQNETGTIFYRNELGQDWYDLRKGLTDWNETGEFINAVFGAWAVVQPYEESLTDGVMLNVEFDPSRLVPHNKIVLGIDAHHGSLSKGMVYEGGLIKQPPEPSPEEKRAAMPALTPRQFRDALIDNDIMPDQVTAAINGIADAKARAKALNAWEYPTEFLRTDQLLEQIGASFDLAPDAIDVMWMAATHR